MPYSLSKKSLSKLEGVHPDLVKVVKRAIELTQIDFAVTEGLRTVERQKELFDKGASTTMKSLHITGHAIDVAAIVGGTARWELNLYDGIAEAIKKAAVELNVSIRWGAAWHVNDIRTWNGSMQSLTENYIDTRRKEGKRPFIDGPHFELS